MSSSSVQAPVTNNIQIHWRFCISYARVTVIHVSEACCKCDSTILLMCMGHVANVIRTYRTCECVVSHMWMSDVTHVTKSCRTYECVIGWVMSHLEWPLRMRVLRNAHNLDTCIRMHSVVWHTYTRTRIQYYIYMHYTVWILRSSLTALTEDSWKRMEKKFFVVCCSLLQCIAVCCSMLQCVAVCCSALQSRKTFINYHSPYRSMLQCVACVAVCGSMLQCVAVLCGALQSSKTFISARTGWPKPIGCLKLQVIFRQRATNNRTLLRKMTCEDK